MGRCEGVVLVFVFALCIACVWSVVSAQSGEDMPGDASPVECVGRHYARYWWTSMWGFVATLVVLTMDAWGLVKSMYSSNFWTIGLTLCFSGLNPLLTVFEMLINAIVGMAMLGNLRDAFGHEMVPLLYPWSKSNIKIIVGAEVVVNLLPDAYKQYGKSLNSFDEDMGVEDLSEAVVIGTPMKNSSKCDVQLSHIGKLALLRANALPPYNQLKILRGNSTLGMIVAAAQAIGYMYAIVVRCIQDLRVSPIEAIGCFLNIVVLMKVVLHNFASVGHRPLHLYMTPDEEAKFIGECNKVNSFQIKILSKLRITSSIITGSLSVVVIYFIINFKQNMNVQCMVPIVLFQGSLVLGLITCYFWRQNASLVLKVILFLGTFLIVLLNAIGYVWALVVSFKYWKEYKFDIQSSNYLSQVLPYIG